MRFFFIDGLKVVGMEIEVGVWLKGGRLDVVVVLVIGEKVEDEEVVDFGSRNVWSWGVKVKIEFEDKLLGEFWFGLVCIFIILVFLFRVLIRIDCEFFIYIVFSFCFVLE